MGKAVPKIIKHRAKCFLEKFPDKFSSDFEKNKQFLRSLNLPFSKLEINLMAGFIARLLDNKKAS
ncbi:MAG: 30S ribosomal protein S17e [Candidatus Diapherotrites archaeon]|uniref:30S ribosomal protein S17e n=1 Tax=Candidatus Iainarchaeum sp. TaxID=3101447 RepID=A0A497JH26_9ARCH|nr:30S ribosomal protein S17e [Candidatus Diapherotrites archaeon]RLG69907.1 MAG: 30S ribosomal protein S17e [Candidatus Diapherotrites archaeon]